jgi:hypothetical protein
MQRTFFKNIPNIDSFFFFIFFKYDIQRDLIEANILGKLNSHGIADQQIIITTKGNKSKIERVVSRDIVEST